MTKRVWEPLKSTVERAPNRLQVSHEQPGVMSRPHWHAQVEINYMMRGEMHYRIGRKLMRLSAGQMLLFWGGIAHQSLHSSDDGDYVVIHLPLMYFFRMRLQPALPGTRGRGDDLARHRRSRRDRRLNRDGRRRPGNRSDGLDNRWARPRRL